MSGPSTELLGNAYGLVRAPRRGCDVARAVGELAHSSRGCGWGWHRGSCRGSWELTTRSCGSWSRNAAAEEASEKGRAGKDKDPQEVHREGPAEVLTDFNKLLKQQDSMARLAGVLSGWNISPGTQGLWGRSQSIARAWPYLVWLSG